jgi:hypothetical protein
LPPVSVHPRAQIPEPKVDQIITANLSAPGHESGLLYTLSCIRYRSIVIRAILGHLIDRPISTRRSVRKPPRLSSRISGQSCASLATVNWASRLLRVTLAACFASRIQRPVQKPIESVPHGSMVVDASSLREPFRISAAISVSRNSIVMHRNAFRRRSRCRRIRRAAAEGTGASLPSRCPLMVVAFSRTQLR